MKKTARVLSLVLVVVLLGAVLAACSGRPSGTYGSNDYNLTFSGSKVTFTVKMLGLTTSVSGTYTMGKDENGKKTITFDFSKDENASILSLFNGTQSYNQGSDDNGSFIEIGGVRYYKK
ncbi:MAG: hypothetical protein IJR88_05980 [Clostridia bacterium]|nr:hypothetical protein [Clostridia bacterium]